MSRLTHEEADRKIIEALEKDSLDVAMTGKPAAKPQLQNLLNRVKNRRTPANVPPEAIKPPAGSQANIRPTGGEVNGRR